MVRSDLGLNSLQGPVRLRRSTHLLCTANQYLVSGQLTNLSLSLYCLGVGRFILPRYFGLHISASCAAYLRIPNFVELLAILGSMFG